MLGELARKDVVDCPVKGNTSRQTNQTALRRIIMDIRFVARHTLALVAIIALLASGCGGGGGKGNVTGNAQVTPATHLITEAQTGTIWSYSITGTATPVAGGSAENVTGTGYFEVISVPSMFSVPAIKLGIDSTIDVIGGQGSFEALYYVAQDSATDSLYELQEDMPDSAGSESIIPTTSPSLSTTELIPGTFYQGESIEKTFDFGTAGDTILEGPASGSLTYNAVVQAPQEVSTPAGSFATWPVQFNITGCQEGITSGTEYWNPALGFFVSATLNIENVHISSDSGGTIAYNMSLTYTLTSTNV